MNQEKSKHKWIFKDEMIFSLTRNKSFHVETKMGYHFSPTRHWQRFKSLIKHCIIEDTGNEYLHKLLMGA